MSDPMAEIRASFFIECEELLEALQDGLQALSDGATDSETVNIVFRAVHSIKGGAGAFGLDDLVAFAHRFETALDEVRSGNLQTDASVLKLFFQCADMLTDLVHSSRDGSEHDKTREAPILADLEKLVGAEDEQEDVADFQPMALSLDLPPDQNTFSIVFEPDAELFASGNEPLFIFRALQDIGTLEVTCTHPDLPDLDALIADQCKLIWHLTLTTTEPESTVREAFDFVEDLCKLTISQDAVSDTGALPDLPAAPPAPVASIPSPAPSSEPEPCPEPAPAPGPVAAEAAKPENAPTAKPATTATTPVGARATVRVDLERVDRLINLVGEIVINQAMLTQSVEEAGLPPNSSVRTGLEEFLQLTRDIQESVMMIRAQPVKSLFQRMARIVREASADIGKEVHLQTDGENTEVDKTVIERLADPLTHMIRNAVDHGLENTDERVAAGKPAEGVVSLTAMHRSGRVVIEVADDGGGIDRKKVHQIAVEKGLVPADLPLSDGEIDNLLFLPGFSTAREISNLSGRGVGMDVVRSAILALGGRISITSERAKGTTFSISLPLTLAVLDGMVVSVANETLVVPLNSILETLALTEEDIRGFGPSSHVVNIRDTFVPLLDLGAELGYRRPLETYVGSVVLLVSQEDGSRAAVVVDAIEDQRQVVIKGLQDSYGRVPGIAAATILGDGQIALILDPVDLITQSNGHTRAAPSPAFQTG